MGRLYIVATPIGHLGDISYRAVETLRSVQLILCEDTRVTKRLLDHYQITTSTRSYHQFTTSGQVQQYLGRLQHGDNLALVSDAGTPGISDPGTRLVQAAMTTGIQVIPIPGPSAFVAALQASGIDTSSFLFLGFLPHKRGRQTLLQTIATEDRTVVFYESPHRLMKTLAALCDCPRQIIVARELTKLHEEFVRGTAAAVYENFFQRPKILGEIVVIVHS